MSTEKKEICFLFRKIAQFEEKKLQISKEIKDVKSIVKPGSRKSPEKQSEKKNYKK